MMPIQLKDADVVVSVNFITRHRSWTHSHMRAKLLVLIKEQKARVAHIDSALLQVQGHRRVVPNILFIIPDVKLGDNFDFGGIFVFSDHFLVHAPVLVVFEIFVSRVSGILLDRTTLLYLNLFRLNPSV